MEINGAHRQAAYPVRFEWGPTGATASAEGAAYAVGIANPRQGGWIGPGPQRGSRGLATEGFLGFGPRTR